MAIRVDPEAREVAALRRAANWPGAKVLEVGCGDGRLTLRLAGLGAQVSAIDPNPSLIRNARRNLPKRYLRKVKYSVGNSGKLRFPPASFDIVVFAWSL
jgi:2-polyprenyl-6-hydroxyphenyl methylase / 3-demethylubiquinone-9 3-methyltransferase